MRHRLRAFLVGALALDAAVASAGWQEDLAVELRVAKGCTVAFLSRVVERSVDGRQVVFAKAHCEDGRVFDASRTDPLLPFDFKECQPPSGPQAC
jgi:hypothetical protein